jgi:hypothetical protein
VPDPVAISLGPYRLRVAVDFGPRILGFRREQGPELFAALGPDVVIDRPDSGVYRFRGGHRLWASPEIPTVTYAPDDEPCQVTEHGGTLTAEGPVDRAGLTKRIIVHGGDDGVVVDHELRNGSDAPLEVAPWALSQLALGGIAIVPVWGLPDEHRLSASGSLVTWPYTDLADPRANWHQGALTVHADAGPAFKVGTGPDPGRLGYLLDGHLFSKTVEPAKGGSYPDRGAVGQFYLGDAFCELETLGPLATLQPGESVAHREVWKIETCESVEAALARIAPHRQ